MFSRFNRLPDEIITKINKYIPNEILTWLSKTYYDKHHATTIENHIKNTGKKLDTYFRYIIRLDNHIALHDMLMNSKINNGVKSHNHKIKYKNKKYTNLIDFLLFLSRENDRPSTKCKNVLFEYVKKQT
uniref:Uncharacterized protein n=1 Tax=viral metagenome TaxID=1070528 RepID=A0A6C0E7J2_9ZZZZ